MGEWSDEEVKILMEEYPTSNTRELAREMERSAQSLRNKAKNLGLKKDEDWLRKSRTEVIRNRREWSREEVEILKKEYPHKTARAIGEKINRSPVAVRRKANYMGLKKSKKRKDELRAETVGYKCWTEDEERFLKENYSILPRNDLEEKLGRDWSAIRSKAKKLGVKRNEAYVEAINAEPLPLDEGEKGYVAGMIDADGSICFADTKGEGGKRKIKPTVSVSTNVSKPFLERLHSALGIGNVGKHARGRWHLIVEKYGDIASLLKTVKDRLRLKAENAKLVLKWFELRARRPDEHTEKMIEIVERVKELNQHRGGM